MKYSELYCLLERNGWVRDEGGRHAKYTHPNSKALIPAGRHKSEEVPKGTLHKIL
ncbi:MAG: type II toxin-antitoxin system HicA family toxin [Mediterranea sp.]|jgi:predicted RNA binding protein YcfA (HicA-like mRNA interferase family)|nr:type II toxin-antitoxin system HicA family toxin [Mediterranea sp.]